MISLHIIELINKGISLLNKLFILLSKIPNISLRNPQMSKNLLNLRFPELFFPPKHLYFLIGAGGEPGASNPIQYLLLFVIESVDFLEQEDYAQVFGGDCQVVLA
jgi:hypothetical protein